MKPKRMSPREREEKERICAYYCKQIRYEMNRLNLNICSLHRDIVLCAKAANKRGRAPFGRVTLSRILNGQIIMQVRHLYWIGHALSYASQREWNQEMEPFEVPPRPEEEQ